MKIDKIEDSTCYPAYAMPSLGSLLGQWLASGTRCKIRVRSGMPGYWPGDRYVRRVHANLSIKDGRIAMKSKHLTDAVLAMPVAKWSRDLAHKSADVYVFAAYGKKKRRPGKNRGGAPFVPAPPRRMQPDGSFDDELPF